MLNENEKFYSICVAAGHVGWHKYISITIPVRASNLKQASDKILGRNGYTKAARVKIGNGGMALVLDTAEISKNEYLEIKRINDEDPFLRVKNVQEQRQIPLLHKRIIEVRDKYAITHDDEFCSRKNVKRDIATRAFGR